MRLGGTKLGANSTGRGLGNQLWDIAGNVPSIDLRFADNKSLVDATTGQNLISFTRASSGTYVDSQGVIRTAATNEPRFDHNPTTGESLGLLVEESRTNLLLRSEEFDNVIWIKSSVTVTANSAIAPDSSTNADTLTAGASGNNRELGQSFTSGAASAYSFTVYLKANSSSWCYLIFSDRSSNSNGRYFDLSNGVTGSSQGLSVGTNVTLNSFSMQSAGNGFWRCSINVTIANSALYYATVGVVDGNSNIFATNGKSIFGWGAQLEAATFPTSYIPTTTATVTRSADVASIAGAAFTSFFDRNQWSLYSEAIGYNAANTVSNSGSGYPYIYSFHETGSNRLIGSRSAGANNGSWSVYSHPPATFSYATSANFNSVPRQRVAAAYSSTSYVSYGAGFTGTSIAPGATTTAFTTMSIGSGTDGGFWGGTIARITYWPQRLSNSTLSSITQ